MRVIYVEDLVQTHGGSALAASVSVSLYSFWSVDSESDVYRIFALLNDYFEPSRVIDFFNNPKSTGYKAFNCFYDNWAFNTEIQIMTKEMRDWTNATHDEHNKRKYGEILTRK